VFLWIIIFVSAIRNERRRIEAFTKLTDYLPQCNKLLLSWMIVHMTHVIERVSLDLELTLLKKSP